MVITLVIVPIGLILLLNLFIITAVVIKVLVYNHKRNQTSPSVYSKQATFIVAVAIIGLMIIFIAAIMFIIVFFTVAQTLVYEVLFAISCIVFGLYAFVFYVLLSKDARHSWKECFKCFFCRGKKCGCTDNHILEKRDNDHNKFKMSSIFQNQSIASSAGCSNAYCTDEINAGVEQTSLQYAGLQFEREGKDTTRINTHGTVSNLCHNLISQYTTSKVEDINENETGRSTVIINQYHDEVLINPDSGQGSTIHCNTKHQNKEAKRGQSAAAISIGYHDSDEVSEIGQESNKQHALSRSEETQESKCTTTSTVLSTSHGGNKVLYVQPSSGQCTFTIRLNKPVPSTPTEETYVEILGDMKSEYKTINKGSNEETKAMDRMHSAIQRQSCSDTQ